MDKPTNPLNLEEIKGLMAAATKGPFSWSFDFRQLIGNDGRVTIFRDVNWWNSKEDDHALIVAAVNALPALIEQYERMREAIVALDRAECFSAHSACEPLCIRFDFACADERLAAANALDDAFETLTQQEETNGYRS